MSVVYLKDLFESEYYELNHFNFESEVHYLGLDFEPDSEPMIGLINCIFDEILLINLNINSDGNELNGFKMKVAVGAICSDLLMASDLPPERSLILM